jgi:hypothetical protein
MPELLILGGGALIVVVDLLFNIVLDWYFIDAVTWMLPAAAALTFVLSRFLGRALPMDYTKLLILAGVFLGAIGVRDLVWDVVVLARRSRVSVEFILPAFLLYVGIVLVFLGAWRLWRGRAA